jgi:hypothetical protein
MFLLLEISASVGMTVEVLLISRFSAVAFHWSELPITSDLALGRTNSAMILHTHSTRAAPVHSWCRIGATSIPVFRLGDLQQWTTEEPVWSVAR